MRLPDPGQYDVEADIQDPEYHGLSHIAGLSPRASVLLTHYTTALARSHGTPGQEPLLTDAAETLARLTLYIAGLERAVLRPYSEQADDTPRELLGVAASVLEEMGKLAVIWHTEHPDQVQHPESLAILANRLRYTAEAIGAVPGGPITEARL